MVQDMIPDSTTAMALVLITAPDMDMVRVEVLPVAPVMEPFTSPAVLRVLRITQTMAVTIIRQV